MKWTFEKTKRGGWNKIKTDARVRFYTSRKSNNAKIYFTKSGLEKIGKTTEFVCFGIGEEGVFVTTEKVGTVFTLKGHGNENSKSVNSKQLVTEIIKALGSKITNDEIIDVNLVEVDKSVWQLVPQTKWGWK